MADDIAIRVENLAKRYRIGAKEEVHDTLAGALTDWVKQPGQNLRRLRSLTRFSENGQQPDDVIWALKDVSFEVKRGEVVGIIGRNGAGKSTLLKILSRITHPTRGRVELDGRVSSLLEVGTGFHPELTGRENIYLNGTILGMRKAEIDRKFDEIVTFSGVQKYIDTPVKRYSSGMAVRLAFAVAAHLEPEILLIDEVLAVGDTQFQRKCIGKMEEVADSGRTVLFVSHDLTSISLLCPKTMLFEAGELVNYCDTQDALNAYTVSDSKATVTWPPNECPGNEMATISRIQVQAPDSTPSTAHAIEDSFSIWIRFNVLQKGLRLNSVIRVKDFKGMVVFSSANYADEVWGNRSYDIGEYLASCTIPGHLLNEGKFTIDAMITIDARHSIARIDDVLTITVFDTGLTRGSYLGKWEGVVRPSCQWSSKSISSSGTD